MSHLLALIVCSALFCFNSLHCTCLNLHVACLKPLCFLSPSTCYLAALCCSNVTCCLLYLLFDLQCTQEATFANEPFGYHRLIYSDEINHIVYTI